MRLIIFLLSIILLAVSGYWCITTWFQPEPLITLIVSLIGVLQYFIFNTSRKKIKIDDNGTLEIYEDNSKKENFQDKRPENTSIVSPKTEKSTLTREDIIDLMKPKLKVLFIDDDTTFKVVKILKDAKWKNTKSVVDIKGLDIDIVKNSSIYFVDINGVGKLLGLKHEGLDLGLMLKEKYPNKKIIMYSANPQTNAFHKVWDVCDYRLEKNALPYQFQKLVEQYSVEIYNQK